MIETGVHELKNEIVQSDGQNIASQAFAARVDELIAVFYDDIDEISRLPTRSLFDLLVIKVLYVGRKSTDASIVDYLGWLLERNLFTQELFPIVRDGRRTLFYLSDLIEETRHSTHFQNLFEAYRRYGDNSLLISGVFSRALRGRRNPRSTPVPFVDQTYFVRTGKWSYRLAAEHDLAEETEQRLLLEKLAAYFELYMDALSEMSERYILGFDFNLIADKMLDDFNSYRRTGEERYLEKARRYAAILKLDPDSFPAILQRAHERPYLIEAPED